MEEEKRLKIPDLPQETQDIMIYNFETRKWQKGYRKDIAKLPEIYTFKWTNCTTTNKAPDGKDVEINIEKAEAVAIQADSRDANSDATSTDVNIMASVDGVVYDSTPYAEMNIGDAEVKTMLINPGPLKIKLRLDYNSGGSRADVTVKVKVRE